MSARNGEDTEAIMGMASLKYDVPHMVDLAQLVALATRMESAKTSWNVGVQRVAR